MENPNENQLSTSFVKAPNALALHESRGAQDKLDSLIAGCFVLQKLYGKQPENIEVINRLFHQLLGKYSAEKTIRAFEVWLERSQEFPTPADIVNLIKRNGKPPLSKERYISISKKGGEDRTRDDWQYLREYEREQDYEEFGTDYADAPKATATLQENLRLRQELREMKAEYARLAGLLRQERQQKGLPAPEISLNDKLQRTVEFMRGNGATQDDIDGFLSQYAHETPQLEHVA